MTRAMRSRHSRLLEGEVSGRTRDLSARTSGYAPAAESVESDRRHNDDADDDILHGVGNIGVGTTVVQYRHDQAADERPQDGPLASTQAPAADDDGRDDPQLEAVGRRRVARRAQEHELEHAGQTRGQPPKGIDDD